MKGLRKRILSVILAIVFVLSIVPMTGVFAETAETPEVQEEVTATEPIPDTTDDSTVTETDSENTEKEDNISSGDKSDKDIRLEVAERHGWL